MLYTMKEILTDAQEKGYGVGYFNAVNMEMVRAYIRAAEQCQSPIIIGTAEALMPYADFNWIVPIMLEQARRAKVPVAVHLDHTYNFELLMQALRAGVASFGGKKVLRLMDYAAGLDGLPKSDVLKFILEDGCTLVARPSGTEPKLKLYLSVSGESREAAEETEQKILKSAEALLH